MGVRNGAYVPPLEVLIHAQLLQPGKILMTLVKADRFTENLATDQVYKLLFTTTQ